jgi:hypothetical protein
MSLTEAIKKFRRFKSSNSYCQTITWPVEQQFVQNKPLTPKFIKELSQFVDNRLIEYSAIQGSIPSTQIKNLPPMHTYAHGQMDSMTNRFKDSFMRLPPQQSAGFDAAIESVISENVQPEPIVEGHTVFRLNLQNDNNKSVSYVTSYDVNYHNLTIKANILTTTDILDTSLDIWIEPPNSSRIIKNAIQANLTIKTITRCDLLKDISEPEKIAMQTLREMITEQEFRHYLKYNFIIVKSSSGLIYQIFRNKSHTKVFKNGTLIEEICVRLQGNVPPTDNVIAFKTMIEANEQEFKALGNVYKIRAA